jgi:hypothetical protein
MRKLIIILASLLTVSLILVVSWMMLPVEDPVRITDPQFNLPDHPIIFTVADVSGNTFGFIDSDGSNFTARQLNIKLTQSPGHYELGQTTWGPDGTFLATQLRGGDSLNVGKSIPVTITNEGDLYFCEELSRVGGSTWGVDSTHILTLQADPLSGSSQIINLNMEACEAEEVLYTAPEGMGSFAVSSERWIAYETVGPAIVILNDQQQEMFRIQDAYLPAW